MGIGQLKNVNKYMKSLDTKRPVAIIDKNLINSEYLNENIDYIKGFYGNLFIEINDLNSEPTYTYLEQIRTRIEQVKPDLIIAIGGGSTMDIGKGICLLLTNNKSALELKGFPTNVNNPINLITIPSIFGSGSEISYNAVFIDDKEGKKLGINSKKNFPKKTIIDPLLTMTAPDDAIISSAMDSLVHCVDSFGSVKSNMLTKIHSIKGFKSSFYTLLKEDISIPENRLNIAVGSICGIIALMNSSDGPINGFAYYFGVKNNIPHGLAGGIFLKDIMSWNYENGFKDYHMLINHDKKSNVTLFKELETLYQKYKIPRLKDFGYTEEDIKYLSNNVSTSLEGAFSGNPITFDRNSTKDILKKQII